MKMRNSYLVIALLLLSDALTAIPLASASTVPAFLWSPYHDQLSSDNALNYETISPQDLAKSVLTQGGWSDLLCSQKQSRQSVDVALVFVGRELQSSHISGNKHADPALVDLLKVSFMKSNFSMAFPYIASSGQETMESSLVSEFTEACGHDFEVSNVAFSESCTVEGENFLKLADLQSFRGHLLSRMEKTQKEQTDLIVFCYGGPQSVKQLMKPRPESEVMSELIDSVEKSGAKYTVLYVSDPVRSIQYPSRRELERFLAETAVGNKSANSTSCDEVCQFKSSLLEGILVGIVLLLILISGLCCMMGIDTPTRFEAPQES
ncbi:2-C-methyl-D-erythritol 4-phosphate cytidylyltransferase [Melia azedarach]|uniref:2-C-methyl-D-erythritol 4-phosphate cytidylyltransferase n=1 Tax=Melia azedarach TaxID=155640 RepID=A0ACC1YKD9_MELAZ|nr:2-C-methyl-D-erythritol 4-phosphate cytidylyltransferase [Melia azedarach]